MLMRQLYHDLSSGTWQSTAKSRSFCARPLPHRSRLQCSAAGYTSFRQQTPELQAAESSSTAAPQLNVSEPVPGVIPPPKAYETAVRLGEAKANLPPAKVVALGVIAGVYIGFGAFLVMSVGAACPGIAASNPGLQKIIMGAFGLPFGLLMVLICGAELFTGNTALVTCALYEGKANWRQLVKSWVLSYGANLIGSLLLVYIVAASGLLATSQVPLNMAVAKTSLTFTQAFARGVLCNWLVCIAIWQASAATTLGGKAIGVWFPISAFIALGLEHCVANMFIIPMGLMLGAPVSWATFLSANLLPVTLGNIVGGALCVAIPYSLIYGSPRNPKPKKA